MSPNFFPDVFPTCLFKLVNRRGVERLYGGLMSASVSTAQWSNESKYHSWIQVRTQIQVQYIFYW